MSHSGVEPTITGVLFGALVPLWAYYDPRQVLRSGQPLLEDAARHARSDPLSLDEYARVGASLREVGRLLRESTSPVERILTRTAPWVSYLILPLFALANAGVQWGTGALSSAQVRISLGVGVGLVVGKPVGILVASALAVRLRVGRLPGDTSWPVLAGVAVTGGVGFTVALYMTAIAFAEPLSRDAARMGILVGSTVAAVCGLLLLLAVTRGRTRAPHVMPAP
jgi:NhaA family Na+:H+ antiporter